jgi:hypothetical protein
MTWDEVLKFATGQRNASEARERIVVKFRKHGIESKLEILSEDAFQPTFLTAVQFRRQYLDLPKSSGPRSKKGAFKRSNKKKSAEKA